MSLFSLISNMICNVITFRFVPAASLISTNFAVASAIGRNTINTNASNSCYAYRRYQHIIILCASGFHLIMYVCASNLIATHSWPRHSLHWLASPDSAWYYACNKAFSFQKYCLLRAALLQCPARLLTNTHVCTQSHLHCKRHHWNNKKIGPATDPHNSYPPATTFLLHRVCARLYVDPGPFQSFLISCSLLAVKHWRSSGWNGRTYPVQNSCGYCYIKINI